MIDEAKQDLATKYVLGELDETTAVAFATELAQDAELRRFVSELHETAAELALAAPSKTPPPELLGRLLDRVHGTRTQPAVRSSSWLPWALAASLAVACSWFAFDRQRAEREIIALRTQDALSRMKIATLGAQAEAYAKVLAVVVWDEEKQRGVLELGQLARPAADRDYQLWVIDPSYPAPVSAGVVEIGTEGVTRASFQPAQPIRSASKFAVSVERKGGAAAPAGEIILLSP